MGAARRYFLAAKGLLRLLVARLFDWGDVLARLFGAARESLRRAIDILEEAGRDSGEAWDPARGFRCPRCGSKRWGTTIDRFGRDLAACRGVVIRAGSMRPCDFSADGERGINPTPSDRGRRAEYDSTKNYEYFRREIERP